MLNSRVSARRVCCTFAEISRNFGVWYLYAKINTYSKINVRRAREREQTMQTFENAFSLILGDIIQI